MRRDDSDNFVLSIAARLPASPREVVAALEPLLTEERRVRIEQVLRTRSSAVTAVLDGLIDPHNVSAVLRSADAFSAQRMSVSHGVWNWYCARSPNETAPSDDSR